MNTGILTFLKREREKFSNTRLKRYFVPTKMLLRVYKVPNRSSYLTVYERLQIKTVRNGERLGML